MPEELTTWGTVDEWCLAFKVKPEWIVGWVLVCGESYAARRRYTSEEWPDPDSIFDDDAVQYVKIFHRRPEAHGDVPARPSKLYSYGMAGRDIYWIPGATRRKLGVYVSNEDDLKFFEDLKAETWDG